MAKSLLVSGPSAASRRARARAFIDGLERPGPRHHSAPVLIVANEHEAADDFARELAHERGSLFGVRRMSLDGLAYRIALPALAAAGQVTHSRLGQEAVTARVLHQERSAGGLGAFESVADGPGLVRALTSTVNECRLHRVAPTQFAPLTRDGAVLSRLAERYDQMLREHGVADRASVYELAREATATSGAPVGFPFVLLDLAVETPVEADFIAAVAEHAPAAMATVPEGDERSLHYLRRVLESDPEPASPAGSEPVRDLQTYLFREEAPASREDAPEVSILSAPGEAQEAVEIARAIQHAAESGTPFDRIAVLLRTPETYTSLLEDALERAAIPAYFEKGTKRPDPAGRAFLALMDCALEDLSAARFSEYLSLSQLPQLDADGAPIPAEERAEGEPSLWVPPQHTLSPSLAEDEPTQLDLFATAETVESPERQPSLSGTLRAPWRWEKLLVNAAVIGGRDRWERRLRGLDRELEIRALELDDPEGAEATAIAKERDDLGHLRRFALPLMEALTALPTNAAWGPWLDALEVLATLALARPEGVLAILKELRPMATVGPVEWSEVRDVLSERLTLLAQRSPDYRYGKVWVAPLGSARGASFDVVLVPGLAERMFPKKIVEDPLLLDEARQTLDVGLPLQADRVQRERLYLRLAVGAANEQIVFSYPSVDLAKGRGKVPSFYLLEIARASIGVLPDFESLERTAAGSSGARIGWPAPKAPIDAIDETEFDLAFLADALRRDTPEAVARGTARYLVDANPALARSLRAKYQRGLRRYSPVDGFVEPSTEARQLLSKHRLEARAYSVTALEKYAHCPYRFYLNAILRLRPRDVSEPPTHLDALTRGHILHDAQFHIVERLEEASLLPVRPENLSEVLPLFELVLDEITEKFHEELAPAIERIWRDELERIRFDLRGWLRREAAATDGYVPYRREYTFGMRPRGPADPSSTLDVAKLDSGLRLRGAIDLVERRGDGKVRVTDHKSGKAWMPESAILNGGESLQPVLYTLAYEALTDEEVESARLYYCTERGGYQERVVRTDESALEVVSEFQRRLDDIIDVGFFPASPQPKFGCRFCDYLPVCGPRMEVDAKRKQEDPRLSPLNWLRNLT